MEHDAGEGVGGDYATPSEGLRSQRFFLEPFFFFLALMLSTRLGLERPCALADLVAFAFSLGLIGVDDALGFFFSQTFFFAFFFVLVFFATVGHLREGTYPAGAGRESDA